MNKLANLLKFALKTFPQGGVHPPEYKELTQGKSIVKYSLPQEVILPVSQHLGVPCEPVVKTGDYVKVGQLIAKSDKPVSANIHASISGTIGKITHYSSPLGPKIMAIPIKSDGKDEWLEGIDTSEEFVECDFDALENPLEKIKNAGIVGLGGAAFPTHIKLSPPPSKKIDTLVINGAECEPFLTCDHRLMIEYPKEIVAGIMIALKVLKVKKAILGIEANKLDAALTLRNEIAKYPEISLGVCEVKYPQGAEKQLIKSLLGREVPSQKLPMDVGVVVTNIGTCQAIYRAVVKNRPLIDRVVTITGPEIPYPSNLLVRLGVSVAELLQHCGYQHRDHGIVVVGGPMMGKAQWTLDVPIIKGSSGIIAFPPEMHKELQERPCLRCGECADVCPMGLEPYLLVALTKSKELDELPKHDIQDCVECASCAYVCPARQSMVHWLKIGKFEASLRKKKN